MTGRWNQAGVPHKGWTCVYIADLVKPAAICEMCEVQRIRYVHTMWHPAFDDELEVGCVCAGHMEGDCEAPREREGSLQRVAGRRSRWLCRKWRVSAKGNSCLNVDGINIVVFQNETDYRWRARITDRTTGNSEFSRRKYDSEDDAKLAAFDAMTFLQSKRGWGVSRRSHGPRALPRISPATPR